MTTAAKFNIDIVHIVDVFVLLNFTESETPKAVYRGFINDQPTIFRIVQLDPNTIPGKPFEIVLYRAILNAPLSSQTNCKIELGRQTYFIHLHEDDNHYDHIAPELGVKSLKKDIDLDIQPHTDCASVVGRYSLRIMMNKTLADTRPLLFTHPINVYYNTKNHHGENKN